MKNFKAIGCLLLIFQMVAQGCSNNPDNQSSAGNLDAMKKDTVAIKSLSSDVVSQAAVSPFKDVDSLVQSLNKNFTVADLEKLENICLKSDGDLTEALDAIAVDLLNDHLGRFLEYLQGNPESCLKKRVIEGLSVKYSAFDKTERPKKLKEEQDLLIFIARKEKLSSGKLKFLNEIFEKVDPNLFE